MLKSSLICLIWHPSIDPKLVSENLGLDPYITQKAGEPITTPQGVRVGGTYKVSKWNHIVRLKSSNSLLDQLDLFIDHLLTNREFIRSISQEGGEVSLYFNLVCPEYSNLVIKPKIMEKLVDMKIEFGFEVFGITQNS